MSTQIPEIADRHVCVVFVPTTSEESGSARDRLESALLGTPAVKSVQHFTVADTKPLPGNRALDYGDATLFESAGSLTDLQDALARRLQEGSLALPVLSQSSVMMYEPVSPVFVSDQFRELKNFDDRHVMLIFSKRPADPTAYDTWYDAVHIRDFLATPGVVRAQRFVASEGVDIPGIANLDHGHLAMYEVEGAIDPVREEIKRQLIAGEMLLPDFLEPPFEQVFLRPTSTLAVTREES